jgi:hypothetical protein
MGEFAFEGNSVSRAYLTHAAPAHGPGHLLDRFPVSPCPCARGIPFMAQASLSTSSWSHLLLNIKKPATGAGFFNKLP